MVLRRKRDETMTTASGTPTAMESPKPARVSQRVAQVCPGRWTRCSHAARTISEGAGRTKVGTLKSRTATSQRTSKATSAAAGIKYSAPRAGPSARDGEVTAAEDEVSDLVGMLAVLRHRLRRHRAGAGELDLDDPRDPARPGRHHDDQVGQEHGFGDAVGHEEDRLAPLLPDPGELDAHLLAGQGVERAERLVHQEHRRIVDEGPADRHPLLHAPRELPRVLVLEAGETDEPDEVERHRPVPLPVAMEDLDREEHVVEHVAPV